MPTLTSMLGSHITAGVTPASMQRTFTGYPGADGITSMNLGKRGYVIPITGQIRVTGGSYSVARAAADAAINAIAACEYLPLDTYTHLGSTYYNAVFHGFKILPSGRDGKTYIYTSAGVMTVKFTIQLIGHT